jgi:hypothetical protein
MQENEGDNEGDSEGDDEGYRERRGCFGGAWLNTSELNPVEDSAPDANGGAWYTGQHCGRVYHTS